VAASASNRDLVSLVGSPYDVFGVTHQEARVVQLTQFNPFGYASMESVASLRVERDS
jgi:hypothetical protein